MEIVSIVATLFLSALTGSSVPCISALIHCWFLALPSMDTNPNTLRQSLFFKFPWLPDPPSVPALVYCLVAQQSVTAVFLATVVPGLLIALSWGFEFLFVPQIYEYGHCFGTNCQAAFSERMKEIMSSTWGLFPLGCPLIIWSAYGGIFTPNEAEL